MISFKQVIAYLAMSFSLLGCYHRPEIMSVATIEPSTGWQVEGRCGYEGCYPLVDFLIGKELQVRVEPRNSYDEGIFVIAIQFITPEKSRYSYTPSLSTIELSDGRTIQAHDFTCSHTVYSLDSFKSDNFLKASTQLNGHVYKNLRYDCFLLFFDTYPPQVDKAYSLTIEGLEKGGKQVKIPTIRFVKGLR